ncbi:MAG: hypothetical protein MI924_05975 [Chloroflexales bacterium]|nr:hypothetical protein [Chloroflexales bacterium]
MTQHKRDTTTIIDYERLTGFDCAWQVASRHLDLFWSYFGARFGRTLTDLKHEGVVQVVLPYTHKPMLVPGHTGTDWSVYILALTEENTDVPQLTQTIFDATHVDAGRDIATLACVNQIRPQPELGMIYPLTGGRTRESRMFQSIEYVFSDPAQREHYYQSQYEFSGPTMQRLHQQDIVGRFIGVEIVDRLIDTPNMPQWDVIHLSGFSIPKVLRSIPHIIRASNGVANALGGPTAWERARTWESQRTKYVRRIRQQSKLTV